MGRWVLPIAVAALLLPAAGAEAAVSVRVSGDTLLVTGDGGRDRIDVRQRGGIVLAAGRRFDRDRFDRIVVRGRGGDDVLRGERVTLDGGRGDDSLTGGDGRERLVGGHGRDRVDGRRGRDSVNLGPGADRFRWDAGDGADRVAGQSGRDRVRLVGTAAPERFAVTASRATLGRTSLRVRAEAFEVLPLGGADRVTAGPGPDVHVDLVVTRGADTGDASRDEILVHGSRRADTIAVRGVRRTIVDRGRAGEVTAERVEATDRLVVAGGDGDDAITGGPGADTIRGGDGDDVADGGAGADFLALGAGDDSVRWDRGDGSDVLEGDAGADLLFVDGSDADEYLELAPNVDRLRVVRDAVDVTVDAGGIESVQLAPRGGADTIAVNDLAGTATTQASVYLGRDGRVDGVIVNAGDQGHALAVQGAGTGAAVAGLTPAIDVADAEPFDVLTANAGGGSDRIDASSLPAGTIALTLDGGAGTDELIGSPGADELRWDAGDGAESIAAGAGQDRLLVNGTNAGDTIALSPSGQRLRATRGAEQAEADDVERVEAYAFAGDDAVTAADLAGTDVSTVHVDGGDGTDGLTLDGSPGDDVVRITPGVAVSGFAATLTLVATERLTVNGRDGEDAIDATGLPAAAATLTIDGGSHDDSLVGGDGPDTIRGGDGDDVLVGGPAVDDLDGGPGNNTVIQD
jgi:Ca2+-binding RTX toxin-like protein